MATKTNSCTKYEMQAVIRFLYHEGVEPFGIYSRIKDVYGDKCLSRNRIFEWVRKLKCGIDILDEATRPGASVKKYFTRWVSWLLTKEIKEKRLNACKEILERYEIAGEAFLDRIVTGDESRIHHHILDSKIASAEWHHKGSPTPKKQRITASAGKPTIRSKRRGLLSKVVCIQHDNTRLHVANFTIETINKLNFKVLISSFLLS
ncbi:hypothetical protein LAZ67_10003046 [Cordylochernes scorpioides]|uniref:Mos1 transposase HTH domain-containing protein n=1 Tax=Cordylochernes scorpioides TaxID=51811 RepID=A0ABY6KXP4_9ARAC|nr:hypothetical protein LAZ67_10003046 [Cordylochernes scorpioides]